MAKKVMEWKDFPNNMQKIKSAHIVRIAILFWLAVLIQVRLSPQARKMIFKTIYAIVGLLSVLGALGTTGLLIYKHSNENKKKKVVSPQSKKFLF